MKALELLKFKTPLLLVDGITNKRVKGLANQLNELIVKMCNTMDSFNKFNESQLKGDLANKIIIAKSLAQYFAGNKLLRVDLAVEALRNQEKAKISEYYIVKNQLLSTLKTIIRESSKEAFVSIYDIFDGNFVKCEDGHEVLVLGKRNLIILETFLNELDTALVVEGNFDKTEAQAVDYNLDAHNRNVELCNHKNSEYNSNKASKFKKAELVINKLKETGEQVVAFHTYKDALLEIGCPKKGVKDYEQIVYKNYIPNKKALSKEFKIELEDISGIKIENLIFSEQEPTDDFSTLLDTDDINDISSISDNNDISSVSEQSPIVEDSTLLEESTLTSDIPSDISFDTLSSLNEDTSTTTSLFNNDSFMSDITSDNLDSLTKTSSAFDDLFKKTETTTTSSDSLSSLYSNYNNIIFDDTDDV